MKALLASLGVLCVFVVDARAHEVYKDNRDRKIVVQVAYERPTRNVVVTVAYRVELHYKTALSDFEFLERLDFVELKRDLRAFGAEFVGYYATVFDKNLKAKGDGVALKFECIKKEATDRDEEGRNLGHLRCDLVYRATFPARPGAKQHITFREANYEREPGHVDLSLDVKQPLEVYSKTEPDEKLKKTPRIELRDGDYDRLRDAELTFTIPADDLDLFQVFLKSDHAVWVLLLISLAIGAIHALTPGHGKTLVAAYLVGEHGTVGHALVLGVVTTITHTGIVLVIALALWLFFPSGLSADAQHHVQGGLGLVMGLLVACMGFWLLLRRLSGKADHFHIGGGHHHHHDHDHHHEHADHTHDAAGNVIPRAAQPVGWWGLIVLGMSGGIVPCWDAVAVLAYAVGVNRLWLAVPMLLAFSAGLASILVLIGILVVHAKRFAASRWGDGRLVRSLPIVSAVCVMALGLWLCYGSLRSRTDAAGPHVPGAHSHP